MKYPTDPLLFAAWGWPQFSFYREQRKILYSVVENAETVVPAGNELGKDFVAAFIVLWFFLTKHPVRVLTTSATDRHLGVLWAEIDRLIRACRYPLINGKGGCLICLDREMKKVVNGVVEKDSYIKAAVASTENKGEGLSGHHSEHTLFVCDEASGATNIAYSMAQGWAEGTPNKRKLIIGNTNPTTNFWFRLVEGGSVKARRGDGYQTKVIRIRAEDSPNYRCGARLIEKYGEAIQDRPDFDEQAQVVPGVLSYRAVLDRRAFWNRERQTIGLDAEFPKDTGTLMFPPDWLLRAQELFKTRGEPPKTERRTMGVDSAEGNDKAAWAVCDRFGLLHLEAFRTRDTTVIVDKTIDLMKQWGIEGEDVYFDRGGGGKEHADRLRRQGHEVQTVAFGGSVVPPKHRGTLLLAHRKDLEETAYAYKNRRAQMYGMVRNKLSLENEQGFAISREHERLLQELAPIPVRYDEENRMYLLPKRKRDAKDTRETLIDLIGHSPDEADALALAVYGLGTKSFVRQIGVVVL